MPCSSAAATTSLSLIDPPGCTSATTPARAGVAAVVQPGGSVRDEEIIAAADEHGMAMLLTGVRHFRH